MANKILNTKYYSYFVRDTNEIRLPVIGIICASCGLIQAGENQNCLYCGIEINMAVH